MKKGILTESAWETDAVSTLQRKSLQGGENRPVSCHCAGVPLDLQRS